MREAAPLSTSDGGHSRVMVDERWCGVQRGYWPGFFLGRSWRSSSKLQASSGLLRVFEAPSSVLLEDHLIVCRSGGNNPLTTTGKGPAPAEVGLIWASPTTGMNQEKQAGNSSH